jgi:hypothetical protein
MTFPSHRLRNIPVNGVKHQNLGPCHLQKAAGPLIKSKQATIPLTTAIVPYLLMNQIKFPDMNTDGTYRH